MDDQQLSSLLPENEGISSEAVQWGESFFEDSWVLRVFAIDRLDEKAEIENFPVFLSLSIKSQLRTLLLFLSLLECPGTACAA